MGSLLEGVGSGRATDPSAKEGKGQTLVYLGTYTGPKSKGIYVCRMDGATGELSDLQVAAETENPSFLAIHPGGGFVYAVNETGSGPNRAGFVTAFTRDAENGKLTTLNKQPSGGGGPCYVVVDNAGRNVLLANYGGGSVAAFPIGKDGKLGQSTAFIQHTGSSVNSQRQKGPHAHSINLDAANHFAVAADLGLDKLLVYRFTPEKGTLAPNDPPSVSVKPGAGPRHFAFHPKGRHAYVINELQSTVSAFQYDANQGVLTELQTLSTLPPDFKGDNSTAEVRVHPSGKFLYGSNRGHDSIVVYAIDSQTGKLRYIENQSTGGRTPRNFGIDPSGSYLLAANQQSDSVVVFRIDPATGRLSPTDHRLEVPTPVCVKFLPVK
jgi:6-phosphogluconolactonase